MEDQPINKDPSITEIERLFEGIVQQTLKIGVDHFEERQKFINWLVSYPEKRVVSHLIDNYLAQTIRNKEYLDIYSKELNKGLE